MPARVLVLLAALAAIVLGSGRLDDDRACDATRDRLDVALFHHRLPAAGLDTELRRLTGACRGATTIARVSTVLTTAGHRDAAVALARRAVDREPRNVWSWLALGQALERDRPREARAAFTRAQALNPRSRLPRATGAGAGRPGA